MSQVSIVVPNYNGGQLFQQCIQSLTRLDYPSESLQIITVDDASTDGSGPWLKALDLPPHFCRVFHEVNRGRAAARNTALRHVQGDIVIFLDGDLFVFPDFVHAHCRAIAQPDVVAVSGRVTAAPHVPNTKLKRYLYDSPGRAARQFGDSRPVPFQFLLTNNASIRKDVLDTAGCFDESLTGYGGEDTLLAYEIWKRYPDGIRFCQQALAVDQDEHSLDLLLSKFSKYAENNLPKIVQRHPEAAQALHADWVVGGGLKCLSGRILFNTLGSRCVKELLPLIPYPLSNYAIRYLLGSVVITALRNTQYNSRAA